MDDKFPPPTPLGPTGASIASYGELRGDPEHRLWIGGAVATLLANYWQSDEPEPIAAALGRQWADDLEAFPRDVISAAITDWRRNNARRPTPYDMIQLCYRHMPKPTVVHSSTPLVSRAERERMEAEAAATRIRVKAMIADAFPELRRFPSTPKEL